MARLITNPAANWLYSSEPEASTNGRRLPVPRGKLLGGSSSINGMVFVRGQAQDFDTWAQMGNRGWSYTDVLPFFKRMKSYAGEGDDGFRGREGPLRVTNPEPRDPLFATIIEAAAQWRSGGFVTGGFAAVGAGVAIAHFGNAGSRSFQGRSATRSHWANARHVGWFAEGHGGGFGGWHGGGFHGWRGGRFGGGHGGGGGWHEARGGGGFGGGRGHGR